MRFMEDAAAITEKHARRINALRSAGNFWVVLLALSIFVPILLVFLPVVGLGYAVESKILLRRYPDMETQTLKELRKSFRQFTWLTVVTLLIWIAFIGVFLVVIASDG